MGITSKDIVDAFNRQVLEDLTEFDLDAMYDEMLDDSYSFDGVGGIFATMQPSQVLKENDPVAYRTGKVDYEDSQKLVEIDGKYYVKSDVEKLIEEFVSELEVVVDSLTSAWSDTSIECLEGEILDLKNTVREAMEEVQSIAS